MLAAAVSFCLTLAAAAQSPTGTVIVNVKERDRPLPCRIHLTGADGKPVKVAHLPWWHDHFVCDGQARLDLAPGRYTCTIERGPEYRPVSETFDVTAGGTQRLEIGLTRIANMAANGWWSGDLHIHRPAGQIGLLLAAEDLHVGPVITWWHGGKWKEQIPRNRQRRIFENDRHADVLTGEDERDGGALLFFGLDAPLPLRDASYRFPPMTASIHEARRRDPRVWIDIEKPFWWETPLWLATGETDFVGLANNHLCRSTMLDHEAWGRPRDQERYPSPRGNGYYSQDLYYQILNSGLRVPPSAGSASGVIPNPVGYNRVYVHLGERFDYAAWWQGLKAGRSFVTNGPLLQCRADGRLPGHVFSAADGRPFEINIECDLVSNDPVPAIEVVQNGRVVATHKWKPGQGRTALPIRFESSGWFLVRAVADVKETFRFASTAPWYVEIDARPFISRAAAQFFLDWTDQRRQRIQSQIEDPEQRSACLAHCDLAIDFWRSRLVAATAP